uniref:Uncharacterized protein n=1 Tax=Avena sativa TaxID=4498 RepID=A0ACD5T6L5_AVESA
MAAATKNNQQTPPPPAPAAASTGRPTVVDPKFEWAEKAGSYVLRLALPGFRKDDLRVQVDGAGRLTVRGSRPAVTGPGSLHKVFQLPATAAVDDITGRFEAGVLTLTVPKRAGAGAGAPPTSIEEVRRKQPGVAKESKPNEEEIAKEDALKKKAMDEATNRAKSRKQEQQKKEEDAKPKAPRARSAVASPPKKPDAAATTADKQAQQQKQQEEEASKRKQEQPKPASAPAKKDENVEPDAATAPPPKHDAVTGTDKAKAEVAPESLAEKVRRRSEEEGANAAPMSAAKRAKTDGEKKAAAASCGGWKERVQGELKVLTDMKWADGLLEAARNNKEVVAIGIAAFSLGLLVSHKLFRK